MEIEATVKIIIPYDNATDEQIQEWLEYSFGARASISMTNPLHDYDTEPYQVIY